MSKNSTSVAKRRVLRGGLYLSLGPIAALLLGFVVNFLVGIYITPDSLGEYSFVNEVVSLTTTVALFGLPGAFTKFLSEYIGKNEPENIESLLKSQTLITITISILSIIFTILFIPMYFRFFGFEITLPKLALIVLTILITILSNMVTSIVNGYYDIELLGVFDFLASVLSRVLVILTLWITFDVYSLLVRFLVTHMILFSIVLFEKNKIFNLKGKSHSLLPIFYFGFPGTAAFAITLIGQNLLLKSLILINFGQTQVGYFDYAFRLATFINTVTIGFFASLNAYYSRLYGEGGTKKIRLEGGWIFKTGLFLFSPIIIGGILVGRVLFEELFTAYLPSLGFFIILTLRLLFTILFRPFSIMTDSIGRTKVKLISTFIFLPVGYFTFLLTASIGPLSIAIAWSIMEIVGFLTIWVFSRYYIGKILIERRKSFFCVLSAFIMAIPVYAISLVIPGLLAIPFMVVIGAGVYILLIRELKLLSRSEVKKISEFLFPAKIATLSEKILIKG